MKLKKIFASALVAVAAVTSVASLSSCSGDKPTTNTPPVDNNDAAAEIQAKLQKAIDGLSLKASYDVDFTLSTTAAGGVTISWASDNKDVISFDNGKATVKRPGIGQADATVKITATAVIDGETKSKDFTVTVPAVEDNAKTIAAIKQLQIGDAVAAKGVVTGFVYAQDDINVRSGFYLTDATGTIYVFGMNTAAEVEEGDEIYFTGTYDCYFGSPQIKNPNDLVELGTSKSADYSAAIKDKTVTDIVTSEVPSGEQATTPTTIHGNVYDMVVYFEKVATDTYVNYRVCDPNNLDNYANIYFRSTIVPGTNYSFTEEFDTYANSYCRVKFVVNGTSSKGKWRGHVLEFSKLTDAEKLQVELMKAASDIPASAFVPADGLEYAIPAITLPEGYTLNVTSDKTCVTYADSKIKITRPEESTTAKITLAIKNGETVVAEHSVSIDLAVGAVDITSAVTINNGYITIPYDAITGDGKYVINVATDKKIYIEWNGFQDKASYKEIGISGGSAIKVTTEGIKLDALISDVYGSYDNMKCYVGTDNTTTPITATKGTGTGTTYTYLFANDAEAVYFLNDSTYSVAFYGLQLVTEGSYVEPEEPETPTEEIEDGIVSILPSAFPAAYPNPTATLAAGNFTWEFAATANYGDGIQMKKQEGTIYNLVALTGKITKIELVWSANKSVYDNNNALKIQLGTDTTYAGNTVYISTVANQKSYSLDITGEYTFIKLTNNIGYAEYWDSIKVYYDGDAPEDVLEPEVNYAEVAEEEAKKLAALIGANYDEETTIDLTSTVGTVAVTPQTGATTLAFADNKLTVTPQANEVTETLTITVTVEGASYTTEAISVKTKLFVPTVGTFSATAQYTAGVSTNMVENENNAKLIGLKEVLFNVNTNKLTYEGESYTNTIGLNKDGTIRLHHSGVEQGSELTITAQSIEGLTLTINKITLTFGSSDNATFNVNSTVGSLTTSEYTINDSSVVIKNTGTVQLRLTKIVIDYTIAEASTTPENPEPETPTIDYTVIEKDTEITFGTEGNYTTVEELVVSEATIGTFNPDNSQFSAGSISFKVNEGATVVITGYSGYTSYTLNGGNTITDTTYTYTATEATVLTLTAVEANNYLVSINVKYPTQIPAIAEDTTITFGTAGNYTTIENLDVTNATIGTFNETNSQFSAGSISFKVNEGATVVITGYSGLTSYKLNDGETITDTTYTYIATEATVLTLTAVDANNYLVSIAITYPVAVNTHAEYVAAADGDALVIQGVVQLVSDNGKYVFLKDSNGNGYTIFNNSGVDKQNWAIVGNEVILNGVRGTYNNLVQLTSEQLVEVVSTNNNVASVDVTEELTTNGLTVTTDNQAKYVTFTGIISSISGKTVSVLVGNNTIKAYDYTNAIPDFVAVGTKVQFTGTYIVYNTTSQVGIYNATGYVDKRTDEEKAQDELDRLVGLIIEAYNQETTVNLSSKIATVVVTPQAEATTLSFADGVLTITPTENEVTETLTISVTVGEETKTSDTITVKSQLPAGGAVVTATATLSFDTKDNRTSYSTEQQVWEQNGVKFTNDKSSSTTNVADYAGPVRLYKSSKITIEHTNNISVIKVTCNSTSYATALQNTAMTGATATVDGKVVTITLTTPATSFVIDALGAQVRVDSIEVVYIVSE